MISLVYVGTLCLHKSVNRSRWPFQTIMFCCESCDSRWLFQTCSAASRAITRLMRRTKSSCTWRESIWRKSFRVIIVASCFPQKSLQLWVFCHRTVSHLNVHFISITFKSLLVWHANSPVLLYVACSCTSRKSIWIKRKRNVLCANAVILLSTCSGTLRTLTRRNMSGELTEPPRCITFVWLLPVSVPGSGCAARVSGRVVREVTWRWRAVTAATVRSTPSTCRSTLLAGTPSAAPSPASSAVPPSPSRESPALLYSYTTGINGWFVVIAVVTLHGVVNGDLAKFVYDDLPVICHCASWFRYDLDNHMKKVHNPQRNTASCDVCGKTMLRENLALHIRNVHQVSV